MNDESPFVVYRFEYERKHLYYLPKDFGSLEDPIPIYLVGTRGTGKTTLLKALNWKERLVNESLRRQLGENAFDRHYIGVYLRLPQVQLTLLTHWLQSEDYVLKAQFIALYIDFLWVEEIASAMADLLAEGVLPVAPTIEHEAVSAILAAWTRAASPDFHPSECHTTKDLAILVRRLREGLEGHARARSNPGVVATLFPLAQFGDFGRVTGKLLGALCDRALVAEGSDDRWYFKICMDESECLDDFQQAVLNSIVRLSEWPSFFVMSYVHLPKERTVTLIPNLTLQKADHRFVELDDMDDGEFRSLAEGVATVRVQETLKEPSLTFDTRKLLGRLQLDRIAEVIVRESERTEAREILKAAEELKDELAQENAPRVDEEADEQHLALPVIEAYLRKKLGTPDSELADRWERRRYESQELRKKAVAAYLSICRELGSQVRYASADMVLQMSDKSIRDFLAQIDAIYDAVRQPLKTFLAQRVSLKEQATALRRASEEKRRSLKSSGVSLPNETGRVVDALAQITADVQSHSHDDRHLRTTERGIFELSSSEALVSLRERIRDAALAGFLKIASDDEAGLRFRVHTSLAAAYGFSYRGAYYPCPVQTADLDKLRLADAPDKFNAVLSKVLARLAGEPAIHRDTLFPSGV